jgi:hypothetical protein
MVSQGAPPWGRAPQNQVRRGAGPRGNALRLLCGYYCVKEIVRGWPPLRAAAAPLPSLAGGGAVPSAQPQHARFRALRPSLCAMQFSRCPAAGCRPGLRPPVLGGTFILYMLPFPLSIAFFQIPLYFFAIFFAVSWPVSCFRTMASALPGVPAPPSPCLGFSRRCGRQAFIFRIVQHNCYRISYD